MKNRYLFSKHQIPVPKKQAHAVRHALKLFHKEQVPRIKAMLDIWSICLGYPGHDQLLSQSKGHQHISKEPFRLTDESFQELSSALFRQIAPAFSEDQCRWAVAGIFDLEGTEKLIEDDIAILKRYLIRAVPLPLDEKKQRLIDLGCLVTETRPIENDPNQGAVIVGYQVTDLGRYAAARESERRRGRPLSRVELVQLGLPETLSRMKQVSASFTAKWGAAQSV